MSHSTHYGPFRQSSEKFCVLRNYCKPIQDYFKTP